MSIYGDIQPITSYIYNLCIALALYTKYHHGRPSSGSKFDENCSLTQAQNQLLTLIEAQMHQTGNDANVNWLSKQLQRDIQSALRRLMDEGLVYDTIREEYLPHTKSRVTTQSPTPTNPHTPSPP